MLGFQLLQALERQEGLTRPLPQSPKPSGTSLACWLQCLALSDSGNVQEQGGVNRGEVGVFAHLGPSWDGL